MTRPALLLGLICLIFTACAPEAEVQQTNETETEKKKILMKPDANFEDFFEFLDEIFLDCALRRPLFLFSCPLLRGG